jgi:hypothetical protein
MNTHVNAARLVASTTVPSMNKQRITLSEREDILFEKLAKLMRIKKAQLLMRAFGSIGLQPQVSEGISPIISLEGQAQKDWDAAVKTFENQGHEKRDFLMFTVLDFVNGKL